MINDIKAPIQYPPLDLKRCTEEPLWCKKEITKRLILLLLEWTRSRPLPFITHIQPGGPGPTRPPVIPSPAGEIYTIRSNTSDGRIYHVHATWSNARNDSVGTSAYYSEIQSPTAIYCIEHVLDYRIFRAFFDFDLSSIPSGSSVSSATLTLVAQTNFGHNVVVLEGTQILPLDTSDYNNFASVDFGHHSTTSGENIISINSAGKSFISSKLGGSAKLAVIEYDNDFLNVAPVYPATNYFGIYFANVPNLSFRPTLTITT